MIDRDADGAALRRDLDARRRVSFPEFDAASRATTFARGVGLPGPRLGRPRSPSGFPTSSSDPNFPRAAVAAREGLHAAFGFPDAPSRRRARRAWSSSAARSGSRTKSCCRCSRAVGHQIGIFVDRRRAQEELDRFFTLSLDMLCIAGFDGYFKRRESRLAARLGYTEDDLLSRPFLDFVHPDDREATHRRDAEEPAPAQNVDLLREPLLPQGRHACDG